MGEHWPTFMEKRMGGENISGRGFFFYHLEECSNRRTCRVAFLAGSCSPVLSTALSSILLLSTYKSCATLQIWQFVLLILILGPASNRSRATWLGAKEFLNISVTQWQKTVMERGSISFESLKWQQLSRERFWIQAQPLEIWLLWGTSGTTKQGISLEYVKLGWEMEACEDPVSLPAKVSKD